MKASRALPLGVLIGRWEFASVKDGRVMGRGTAAFDWTDGGAFVIQRAEDHPDPDSDPEWMAHSPMPVTSIIGFDDTTFAGAMLYSDARGVFRIYQMSLDGDAWRLWRAAPDFHQRFAGSLRDNGRTIDGTWESSPDGSAWETDFQITYRKVD